MFAKQQPYVLPNCTISPLVRSCPLISPPHWFRISCYLLHDTGTIFIKSFFSFATTPLPHPPSHIIFCRLGFSLLFLFWRLRPRPLPCIPYCLPLPLSLSICPSLSRSISYVFYRNYLLLSIILHPLFSSHASPVLFISPLRAGGGQRVLRCSTRSYLRCQPHSGESVSTVGRLVSYSLSNNLVDTSVWW